MKLIKTMYVNNMDYPELGIGMEIGIYELNTEERKTLNSLGISGKYVLMNTKTLLRDASYIKDFMSELIAVITKNTRLDYKGVFETQLEAELYFKCITLENQINHMKPVVTVKDM